jgi:hypothetical protein
MNHYDTILLGLVLVIAFIIVFMNGKSFEMYQEATAQPVPIVSASSKSYSVALFKRPSGGTLLDMDPADKNLMMVADSSNPLTIDKCFDVCNKYEKCKGFYYNKGAGRSVPATCTPYSSNMDMARLGNMNPALGTSVFTKN